ncbi:hypothetical protein IRZ59_08445 [Pseudomonas guariconensis]|uniref:hypothetical protein n=1 Tax=Pseudomonas guariconensis TaxID=1288410 RepID=UPI0018AAFAC5|nr:hypothetical protein [Pseudomonas guariconensis]MBF8730476.1 hypothetical protein [Pseudomonas guariconensis]
MSARKSDHERFSVQMDDFIRFLEEKTSSTSCAACGNDLWTILGWADTDVTFRAITPLLDGPKEESASTFALFCNNCGFLRHHMSKVVRDWVDSNPAPEQLDLDGLSGNDSE